jgi:putative ABC transport system permease protein
VLVVTDQADTTLTNHLKKMPEIEDVEVRDSVLARFQTGPDSYVPLLLFSVSEFTHISVNKFTLEKGIFPERDDQIVIERTASKLTDVTQGSDYSVVIPGTGVFKTRVSGFVHDPGLAPSWMEGVLYGYVNDSFAAPGGVQGPAHTILLTVKDNKYDIDYIKKVAEAVIEVIKKEGRIVYRSEVLKPGRHVHQGQMDSLMFILFMFGILTLILSCSLIVNMISAIMAREIRQIGVMKAIGASTGKIASIYLSMVLIIAFGATIIATPIGILAGTKYAGFVASMLNFTLFDTSIGIAALCSIIFIGTILPGLVALIPVYQRASTSVNDALNDYGVNQKVRKESEGRKARSFLGITVPQTLLLALRNTLRRKTRFVLTLTTLILAGAVFMTTFNIRASMTETVSNKFDKQRYDLAIVLNTPYPIERISKIMSSLADIEGAEYWLADKITRVTDGGLESSVIDFRAVTVPTKVFSVEVIAGSWLESGDAGVVINHALAVEQPDLTVGKKVRLKINGRLEEVTIKGIIREIFTPPTLYMDYNQFAGLNNSTGTARLILADVRKKNAFKITEVTKTIEKVLLASGIDVKMVYNKHNYKARVIDHLIVVTSMLIMMTCLIIVVGGLGIVITMGINIVERRREIGILRAIGATDGLLYRILGYEGLFMGIISWLSACVLSLPLSYYLGNVFFQIFFQTSMEFTISPIGFIAGFFVNVAFGSLAVLIPTRSALKLAVSGALAYE